MKILIAVSDNYFGEAILGFMRSRKWQPGTKVRIIHALEPGDESDATMGDCVDQRIRLLEKLSCELKRYDREFEIQKSLLFGKAAPTIIEDAASWQPDMIVMGSHGRKGLEKLVLGSVAMNVTGHSDCSIVIVKPMQSSELDVCLCEEEDMPQQICSSKLEDKIASQQKAPASKGAAR